MQKNNTASSAEHLSNTNFGWDQERTSDFLRNFVGDRLAKLATIDLEGDE